MSENDDPRVPNKWGFTSFPTEATARAYVRRFGTQRGRQWHIWRLPDGTFDFTSGPEPRRSMRGQAELIGTQAPANTPVKEDSGDG